MLYILLFKSSSIILNTCLHGRYSHQSRTEGLKEIIVLGTSSLLDLERLYVAFEPVYVSLERVYVSASGCQLCIHSPHSCLQFLSLFPVYIQLFGHLCNFVIILDDCSTSFLQKSASSSILISVKR